MTYWPISSPSIFAASKQNAPDPRLSHDGAPTPKGDDRGTTDEAGGPESSSPSGTPSDDNALANEKQEGKLVNELEVDRSISRKQLRPEESPEDDVSGEIIGIRVTRSGHMFATITRSTLTVWQTKV